LSRPEDVLALVDPRATVGRYGTIEQWTSQGPDAEAPRLAQAQLARSPRMHGLVQAADGILIGEIGNGAWRAVVVTDPDIAENHGFSRGANASIVASIVRRLRGNRAGRVVFDETVHGIVARPFSAMRLLFGFPFAFVTLQVAIAAALLLWSGSVRFGTPRPREAALPLGKRSLIESGSRLLEHAARLPFLIERYAEAIVRETAQAVNAPRGLTHDQLVAWFNATGRTVPAAAADTIADTTTATAEAMYRWRDDVLDESGQRTHRR